MLRIVRARRPGAAVDGPALIQQEHSALVVPSGWRAHVARAMAVSVWSHGPRRLTERRRQHRRGRPQAVELELMSHRFSSIAREMGEMLQRTAISTNIKEREDFSCTLLDPDGRLVVNAPHIPVHLGAMGLCVRELVAHRDLEPGDVVVTNHPAFGGSHLPDVTLVAPVHLGDRLLGYVACRAHHAEIGGIRPGSVPPDARSLAEEGVVIPPTLLVEGGEPRWERVEQLLPDGPYPTRTLADNLADLRAMLAAILRGREALTDLAEKVGFDHVLEHMDALRQQAAWQVETAAREDGRWPLRGPAAARRRVAAGCDLHDRRQPRGARLRRQRGPVHPGNLNATPAIVHSVTMYVMRLLVDVELPLNEGLLEPVEIRIPRGLLNPAVRRRPEALSGGGRRQRRDQPAADRHPDRGVVGWRAAARAP